MIIAKKKKKRKIFFAALPFAEMAAIFVVEIGMVFLLCACGGREPENLRSAGTAMGTVVQQNLYTVSHEDAAPEEMMELLRDLESDELSWRLETSEISRVNASAGVEEGILLSEELSRILARCLEISESSEGAFDVSLGPVTRLWDLDSWAAGEKECEFTPPEKEALEAALARCGSSKLRLEEGRLFLPEGMSLDLGAVGKGIALDRIHGYLREKKEITGATISVGGSVLTYGRKPDGVSWKVGILDPADTSSYIGVLSLEGQWCVSTSGNYERYVESGGVRYHHIFDPADGYPADSGLLSVTVLTKDGFLSDALSTACFILGKEAGMSLAEKYEAEALFVEEDGRLSMTEGMREFFTAR